MPNAATRPVSKPDMRSGSATVGGLILVAALTTSAAAPACQFGSPMMGWSPHARLPRSLSEAEQLAAQAREPAPVLPVAMSDTESQDFSLSYARWLGRVTSAAARASAWYLTAVLGPEPFREQASELDPFYGDPLPNLGPATAAYVIIGGTTEDQWSLLENAIATPPAGASAEHFIETLADVGFLFADISKSVRNGFEPDGLDYVRGVVGLTHPVARVLLRQCRRVSTQLQTWTAASRRCEEWLGANWKAELELASLDELLPRADRVPLTRLGFAPVVLCGRP